MAEAPATPAATATATATPPAEAALGDAGKKALDAERDARQAAEKQAKDFQSQLEKLQQQTMSDQEKAVEAARKDGYTDAIKKAAPLMVSTIAKAEAATKLADPDTVAMIGDLNRFVGDDGTIDTQAISSAIDDLVKSKPHLAAGPGKGAGEGGPRGGARPPASDEDPLLRDLKSKLGIPD